MEPDTILTRIGQWTFETFGRRAPEIGRVVAALSASIAVLALLLVGSCVFG